MLALGFLIAGIVLMVVGAVCFLATIHTAETVFALLSTLCFPLGGLLVTIGLVWLGIANWDSIWSFVQQNGSL